MCSQVYRDCAILVHGHEMPADLVLLPLQEFDVILGMDWLSCHRARVDCYSKIVSFGNSTDETPIFVGIRRTASARIISAVKAERLLRRGCEAFLAQVIDTTHREPQLEEIPVVREFADVFPADLSGLPPERG